ncbi:unnamed protein product [Protopolystoma xenopodis]|uniref:Nipped-B protein n=1 Tax=Protopolystoma xenopodis TaxID=117903 RepID=A0A3S5A015_9PLAT|nr:unnamed protein product [Protopolystoma xenopodis]
MPGVGRSLLGRYESLKELQDRRASQGSAVAQSYLPFILSPEASCCLSPVTAVRAAALSFLSTLLRQGLLHPAPTLAHLICLQTDPDPSLRAKASSQLAEVERKTPGFVAMRVVHGIRLSFRLHKLIRSASCPSSTERQLIRGVLLSLPSFSSKASLILPLVAPTGSEAPVNTPLTFTPPAQTHSIPLALNHASYCLIRDNRQQRRSIVLGLLGLFDLPAGSTTAESHCTAAVWLCYDAQVDAVREASCLASSKNSLSFRPSYELEFILVKVLR